MAFKVRRGTAAQLAGITPAAGEPVFTTDTKIFTVGDGATLGGVAIGPSIATVPDNTLTLAKIVQTTQYKLLGRGTSGTGNWEEVTTSANTYSLLACANYAAMRTALGLVIGTNVQAQDAELECLSGLTSAANKLPYFTGAGTAAVTDFTSDARTLTALAMAQYTIPVVNTANVFTALAVGVSQFIGRKSSGAIVALTATEAKVELGLTIGTNVQAYDADLSAIAGLTSAADKVPYFTGLGTAATADFTASGRALVATASAAAQRAIIEAAAPSIVSLSGNTTLTAASHQGKLIECSATLALTVNASTDFDAWASCEIVNMGGAGAVVSITNTATVNTIGSKPLTIPRFGRAVLSRTGTSDVYLLTGEMA